MRQKLNFQDGVARSSLTELNLLEDLNVIRKLKTAEGKNRERQNFAVDLKTK